METGKKDRQSRPVRVSIAEIDQEILRLLVRRSNLLAKIREKGHVSAQDEKYLREAWQNDVARVSRDPELSGRFFTLMQQISFLPKPGGGAETGLSGSQRRNAFNLAPPDKPVTAALVCPLSGWQTQAWLYLAAASGEPLQISPTLQNDQLVDFVRSLGQMGGGATREDATVLVRKGAPMAAPDKVIHAGTSEFGLYLIMAHYIGRYARVKLTGDGPLGLLNLSGLGRLLPELGCRMINIVPKSDTLPVRLEASGLLPPALTPGPGIPPLFICALLLAAPFYSAPFAIDLAQRPDKDQILGLTLPILEKAGAVFALNGDALALEPASLAIPASPELAMEPELAAFLAGFAAALGGRMQLAGLWPDWPSASTIWQICAQIGFIRTSSGVTAEFARPISEFECKVMPDPGWQTAFATALAACACLGSGRATLPAELAMDATVTDFLRVTGIETDKNGALRYAGPYSGLAWTAPDPAWALAYALAACRRRQRNGWPLGNPGIMTELWPLFWQFYNSLPEPQQKVKKESQPEQSPARRRIKTGAVAVPPQIREEDWD